MSKNEEKHYGSLIALWIFIVILVASLISLILALCVFNHQIQFTSDEVATTKPVSEEDSKHTTTNTETTEEGWLVVSSAKLLGKMAQQEDFLLYVGRPTCPHCQAFVPMLKAASDELNQPEVFYYNTDKAQHKKTVLKTLGVEEVPNLLYIKDGIVFDRLDNVSDQNAIKAFLEKYKE